MRRKRDFCVRISSQEAVHTMWIADIQDEYFLELHVCMLDLREHVLLIKRFPC